MRSDLTNYKNYKITRKMSKTQQAINSLKRKRALGLPFLCQCHRLSRLIVR